MESGKSQNLDPVAAPGYRDGKKLDYTYLGVGVGGSLTTAELIGSPKAGYNKLQFSHQNIVNA